MTIRKFTLLGVAASAIGLAACGTVEPAVPLEYIQTNTLERHPIKVAERTQVLEIELDPADATLPRADRQRIKNFVSAYAHSGHGPLTMLLPEETANPQLAVNAVVEARRIAFSQGVDYEEIDGGSALPDGGPARLYLAFKSYDSIAPDCESFANTDFAAARSNNDLPMLGCSVRTNLAAMVADPADLLGERPLDPGDAVRRQTTFDLYRAGEATAAQSNEGESGVVSTAIGPAS